MPQRPREYVPFLRKPRKINAKDSTCRQPYIQALHFLEEASPADLMHPIALPVLQVCCF